MTVTDTDITFSDANDILSAAWSLGQFGIGSVCSRNSSSEDLLKGNPAAPGGWLTSKPTWLKPCGVSASSAFFGLMKPRRHGRQNLLKNVT